MSELCHGEKHASLLMMAITMFFIFDNDLFFTTSVMMIRNGLMY